MKSYNEIKVYQYINNNIDIIETVYIGMYEDWWWTAESIFENVGEKFDISVFEDISLHESYWATPSMLVRFMDGSERLFDVSKGESDGKKDVTDIHGALSIETQNSLPKLEMLSTF